MRSAIRNPQSAMFLLLPALVFPVAAQEVKPDRTITFSVANMQCAGCKKALESGLKGVKGVTEALVDPRAKTVLVTYDHHLTSAARLATHLAAVKPLHVKPFEAALLVTADDIPKDAPEKIVAELKTFKNPYGTEPIANATVDVEKKLIQVFFKPVKLEHPQERGTDVNPVVNYLSKTKKLVPTARALAPTKTLKG